MLSGGDASLNVPLNEDGYGQWQDHLRDEAPLQDELLAYQEENQVRRELLAQALANLTERERHILTERRMSDQPKTLEELSEIYHVSRERIRQIEVRAFEKVERTIRRLAKDRLLIS